MKCSFILKDLWPLTKAAVFEKVFSSVFLYIGNFEISFTSI